MAAGRGQRRFPVVHSFGARAEFIKQGLFCRVKLILCVV
jgi:hypothetical protein